MNKSNSNKMANNDREQSNKIQIVNRQEEIESFKEKTSDQSLCTIK